MTSVDHIAAGPKIREFADELMDDWIVEESSPVLRDYLDDYRKKRFPEWTLESRDAGFVLYTDRPFAMFGLRSLSGDTAEMIGPYVSPHTRRIGIGSTVFCWAVTHAATVGHRKLTTLVNAVDRETHDWLERRGLLEIPRYHDDPGGSHMAFGCDLAEQARFVLTRNGVPRGRGKWSVVVHNDDQTPYDFVVDVMRSRVDLRGDLAEAATRRVHLNGRQVVRRCLTKPGAARIAEHIIRRARAAGHPLRVSVEPNLDS